MSDRQRCAEMPIESLNVGEECLDGLRKSDFVTVGQLVSYLKQVLGNGTSAGRVRYEFLKYLPETVNELKAIGCWPEGLEFIDYSSNP
jgi:hypothetical protein